MKKYNPIYYLLFVLLIMGAFASMAQNDYGIKILGLIALAFSLLFTIQLISVVRKKAAKQEASVVFELFSLILLSLILCMRVFYIRFPFVELVFGGAGLLLVLVYIRKSLRSFRLNQPKSSPLAWLVLLFHSSIVLYVLSMITVAFIPSLSEPAGGIAFALLLAFVSMSLWNKEIMFGSEKITGFAFVARVKDRSIVLITLFLLFTAYMGLTKIRVLPKMYSDEFPQTYFQLVNRAETQGEKPVDGKYKHEEFKAMYDRFVERNIAADKK